MYRRSKASALPSRYADMSCSSESSIPHQANLGRIHCPKGLETSSHSRRMRPFSPNPEPMSKPFPVPVKSTAPSAKYSCLKCPGYCCSYPEIEVTPRDIERLAKHFDISYSQAEERLTKYDPKEKVRLLRHQ